MAADLEVIHFLNQSHRIEAQPFVQPALRYIRFNLESLIVKMLAETSKASVDAMKEQIREHQERHEELKILVHIKHVFLKLQQAREQETKKSALVQYV